MKRFEIIYMDPPWDYQGQTQHGGINSKPSGGAISHYPTMTVDQMLEQIRLPAADNCLLFMWSSNPHLDQALRLGQGWGFKYATVAFVWHKQAKNPGFYTMSECELCLVFKKGKIPEPRGSRCETQFISRPRQAHSKKPDEIRQRIAKMFPAQNKLEMFARQQTPGWHTFGNQTDKFPYQPNIWDRLFNETGS